MDFTWRNFWFAGKTWFEGEVGMLRDHMHVHFGLSVFLILALLFRNRRYGMLLAWSVVAGLQIINETLDARDWINWTGSVNWSETSKDTVATLFWPTVLLLVWPRISR